MVVYNKMDATTAKDAQELSEKMDLSGSPSSDAQQQPQKDGDSSAKTVTVTKEREAGWGDYFRYFITTFIVSM